MLEYKLKCSAFYNGPFCLSSRWPLYAERGWRCVSFASFPSRGGSSWHLIIWVGAQRCWGWLGLVGGLGDWGRCPAMLGLTWLEVWEIWGRCQRCWGLTWLEVWEIWGSVPSDVGGWLGWRFGRSGGRCPAMLGADLVGGLEIWGSVPSDVGADLIWQDAQFQLSAPVIWNLTCYPYFFGEDDHSEVSISTDELTFRRIMWMNI